MRSEAAAGKGILAWTIGVARSPRANAATVFGMFIRACSLDFRCILDHVSRPEECLGARRAQSIPGSCAGATHAGAPVSKLRRFLHWSIFALSVFPFFKEPSSMPSRFVRVLVAFVGIALLAAIVGPTRAPPPVAPRQFSFPYNLPAPPLTPSPPP